MTSEAPEPVRVLQTGLFDVPQFARDLGIGIRVLTHVRMAACKKTGLVAVACANHMVMYQWRRGGHGGDLVGTFVEVCKAEDHGVDGVFIPLVFTHKHVQGGAETPPHLLYSAPTGMLGAVVRLLNCGNGFQASPKTLLPVGPEYPEEPGRVPVRACVNKSRLVILHKVGVDDTEVHVYEGGGIDWVRVAIFPADFLRQLLRVEHRVSILDVCLPGKQRRSGTTQVFLLERNTWSVVRVEIRDGSLHFVQRIAAPGTWDFLATSAMQWKAPNILFGTLIDERDPPPAGAGAGAGAGAVTQWVLSVIAVNTTEYASQVLIKQNLTPQQGKRYAHLARPAMQLMHPFGVLIMDPAPASASLQFSMVPLFNHLTRPGMSAMRAAWMGAAARATALEATVFVERVRELERERERERRHTGEAEEPRA